MNDLLRVKGVDASYGAERVLKGITVSFRSGEIVALIGPNGAGKTTLVKVLSRTMKSDRGLVEWRGRSIWRMNAREYAKRVALLNQGEKLAWPYTVEQVVLMGRFAHRGWVSAYSKADRAAADKALELTGLTTLRDRSVHTLSGGQAQRAMLARTIAQEPELLILDEPVSHLDIKHRLDVMDTARSFADAGGSVVICMHDLTLSALYADRVVLLHDGEVRCEGAPETVLEKGMLERVYETQVVVARLPGIDRPLVMPVPVRTNGRSRGEEQQ